MNQTEHWQITVETPIGVQSGTLEFTQTGNAIEGRLFNDSGELKLRSGSIEGESLCWEVELSRPIPMTIRCRALREGEQLTGSATVAAFGDITFTGRRKIV